jgi:tetratricopeptide (TPR) repeat protein
MEFKYNPGFSSDADLIESFVVRKPYLDLILENLRENTGSANQHVLVVGARGTGKTMLVRRVAAEVRTDPQLDSQWYPLVFAEESYQITSVGEFWLEALFHVADQTQDASWQTVYEELRTEVDETRLRQRALAKLMDFADSQGKRILLVVENLNTLFEQQLGSHDDWDLRYILQNEPRLMLLGTAMEGMLRGTATKGFKQIEALQKAWFEFFTIYQLEALSLEECQVLLASITGKPINDSRLKPIWILTGGNTRLLRILMDFVVDLSLKDLMTNLHNLIDAHTDYFKSHLDHMAAAERKVFIALLELWDPMGAREIATASRMNVSQTSSLLNRLVSRGAVMVVQAKGRKKLYQATERLYNIYYLMRRRSHPSSRVRAAVTFMVSFYQGNELVDATAKLANEACLLNPTERADHFYAYQGILDATQQPKLREELLKATPPSFFSAPDAPESLRQLLTVSPQDQQQEGWEEFTKVRELFDLGHIEDALTLLDSLVNRFEGGAELPHLEGLANALFIKGFILGSLGRLEDEIAVYDDLIRRLESRTELPLLELLAKVLFNKGGALGSLGRLEDEIAVYDDLIRRLESRTELPLLELLAKVLFNKGFDLGSLGRLEDEIAVYNDLIRRLESCTELPLLEPLAKALFNKGDALGSLGQLEDEIAVYDDLIRRLESRAELPLLEQLAKALFNKGGALGSLGRLEEAIAVYNDLIRRLESRTELPLLEPLAKALVNKGFRLGSLGRLEEAEKSVRESLKIAPMNWKANGLLAHLLISQQKWTELWNIFSNLLIVLETEEAASELIIDLLLKIAATGHAARVLQMVSESKIASNLEPLVVGLQLFLGEQPLVAQEILEIGQDVAQRIREKQQAF